MNKIYLGLDQISHIRVGVVSLWVILLTASLSILSLFFEIAPSAEIALFIVLMLILGIPHGATDHLVFFSGYAHTSKLDWVRFLGWYLGIMLVYSLAWYFFPMLCFIIFLLFSAYHFGQSQLYYLSLSEGSWLKSLLYLFWGVFVLLVILGLNASQSLSILKSTPFVDLMNQVFILFLPLSAVSLGLLMILFFVAHFAAKVSLQEIAQELGLLSLLVFLSWSTSLLWSFAIYFALWHSLQTIEQEIKIFRQKFSKEYNWKSYAKDAFVFSLISFIGIVLILISLNMLGLEVASLLFSFFVMISILTAPHAWLIGAIYQQ